MQKGEICALLGYHVVYRILTDVLGQTIGSGDPRRNISSWISWPLRIRPMGCPLHSVRNDPYVLRTNTEEGNLIYFVTEAWNKACGKEASDNKAFNIKVTYSVLTSKILVNLCMVVMHRSWKERKQCQKCVQVTIAVGETSQLNSSLQINWTFRIAICNASWREQLHQAIREYD
jgi:hypothetical protein